ncbi:unnamed protein product [Protopolystoma xenopodis]|uniref:Uncharacterized protein n=1 Tax=Protopolystoma xenopodis TaxID=117903 RepID=A0A448WWX6_9PLAT|nr:unnamed protein product [Protopolystoma xenopodis]
MAAPVSSAQGLVVRRLGRVLLLGLDHSLGSGSTSGNRIGMALLQQLSGIVRDELGPAGTIMGAGVLHSVPRSGGDFCLGTEIVNQSAVGGATTRSDLLWKVEHKVGPRISSFQVGSTKPLIAAISGRAIGIGLQLAMLCDVRIAEEDSLFGLGSSKEAAALHSLLGPDLAYQLMSQLAKMIGPSLALDLLLSGRQIKATDALNLGLISQVVKTGTGCFCKSHWRVRLVFSDIGASATTSFVATVRVRMLGDS